MEPIASLSRTEFEELRDAYLEDGERANAPSLIDALEMIRSDMNDMLEKTLSGASGKLNVIPWTADSLLHATLPCDRCLSKCRTHLADAPLRRFYIRRAGRLGYLAGHRHLGAHDGSSG